MMEILRSPLNALVTSTRRATVHEYWGWEIVAGFGDPRGEYDAVVGSAGVLDVSYAGKLRVTGRDRVRYLHSMLSNDIKSLGPGNGCYAALLSHQGRMESDVFVYAAPEELWLECSPAGRSRLIESLNRFIVSDDVLVEDWTRKLSIVSVQGPRAAEAAGKTTGVSLEPMALLDHRSVKGIPDPCFLVRRDRTGCGGFDIWASPEDAAAMWQRWVGEERLRPVGHQALDWLRTEAGIPWFGVDMDDRRLPMEMGLTSALSYTKGCYRGQEIVARVTHRGRLDRGFGGIALGTSDPPPAGAEIRADGARIGEVTSATFSPALGSVLALGILKLEFLQPDQPVEVLDRDTAVPGRVVGLPLPRVARP